MIRVDIQLLAHKKGMGSTRNGRDSKSKRLGAKKYYISSTWHEDPSRTECRHR